jgi:CDP-diglyceride synthetase
MIIIFFIVMAIPDRFGENATAEVIAFIIWGLVNAICCFFIVKQNPKSIWYVPLIINAYFILPAVFEDNSWKDWLFLCGTLVLSIIASIIGARIGKRTTKDSDPAEIR